MVKRVSDLRLKNVASRYSRRFPEKFRDIVGEDNRVYKKHFASLEGVPEKDVIEFILTKYIKGNREVYKLTHIVNDIDFEPVFVWSTPNLSYLGAALNWINYVNNIDYNGQREIKLAGEFKKELLEKHDISCPIQADALDQLEDKESLFSDCSWLEDFLTRAEEE